MTMAVESWSVRGYEADADGYLPPHVWLRYMEHLRWMSAGRGPRAMAERFGSGEAFMLVAQSLVVHRDVRIGTEIEGKLWLAKVGNTSANMVHTFRDRDTDESVATGAVTVVYVRDGRPAPVPERLRERVATDLPADLPVFPEPAREDPPKTAFSTHLHVRPADIDLLRHMNHSNYSIFADAVRLAAARQGALGDSSGPAAGRVRGMALEYVQQALVGEKLRATTWVAADAPLALGFQLRREDVLLCRGRLVVD